MKKLIPISLSIFFLASCGTTKNSGSRLTEYYSKTPDLTKIVYEGGDGKSIENAIIIKFAKNEREGIASEYAYIEKNYGKKFTDWKVISQSTGNNNNRKYDILKIQTLPKNEMVILYFDITGFYGKL